MSANESALSQSIQRALEQGREYGNCGIPFPAWLVKKLKAVLLLETDRQAGLALLIDGVADERDAIQATWLALFHDDLPDEKDAAVTGGEDVAWSEVDGLAQAERHG